MPVLENKYRSLQMFARCQRGATGTILACMISTLAISAASLDVIVWMSRRAKMQEIADKAALSAAQILARSGRQAAMESANNILLANDDRSPWRTKGLKAHLTIDEVANKIAIRLEQEAPIYFARAFTSKPTPIAVSAEAIANVSQGRECVIALDPQAATGFLFDGDGLIYGPDCIMRTASTGTNSVTIKKKIDVTTRLICGVGGVSNNSTGMVSPAPTANCPPPTNPYAALRLQIPAGCDHTKLAKSEDTVILKPGTYCGDLSIDGRVVIAEPGVYFIKDGMIKIKGTSSVSFSNSTIYLSGKNAGISLDGESELTIVAPTMGATKDIAVAMDPDAINAKASEFKGNSKVLISGIVHLPSQRIAIGGDSMGTVHLENAMLIAGDVTFGGSANWRWTAVDKLPMSSLFPAAQLLK
jgi:hypothetical protein